MGKYVDPNSFASNSGSMKISKRMLKAACPDMFGHFGLKPEYRETYKRMQEYMLLGDTQPAIVYSLSPFLIAAYSADMDAVVMVHFNEDLIEKYGIVKGQRMVSVNVYEDGNRYGFGFDRDIIVGPGYCGVWTGFTPHIGDLLSDEKDVIENHKKRITEEEWQYVGQLAEEYVEKHPWAYRDGRKGLATGEH